MKKFVGHGEWMMGMGQTGPSISRGQVRVYRPITESTCERKERGDCFLSQSSSEFAGRKGNPTIG